jgi:hypothetical protein
MTPLQTENERLAFTFEEMEGRIYIVEGPEKIGARLVRTFGEGEIHRAIAERMCKLLNAGLAALSVHAATAAEPHAFESLAHMETLGLGNPAAATVEREQSELEMVKDLLERERVESEYQKERKVEAIRLKLAAQGYLAEARARLQSLEQTAAKMAGALADAAGYLASVRTDRLVKAEGEVWTCQTRDWAEGAKEFAEKGNAILEEYDDLRAAQPVAAQREEQA